MNRRKFMMFTKRRVSIPPVLAIPTNINVVREKGANADLLFKSGFEGNVQVLEENIYPWNTTANYRGIVGNDEGFDWSEGQPLIPTYGDGVSPYYDGIHVIEGGSTPQDTCLNELVTITGHDGNPTTALKQTKTIADGAVYGGPGSQMPYQINRILNIPKVTYQRFWIRYDDLAYMENSGEVLWRMPWQYKSGDWENAATNGYRTSVLLRNDPVDGLNWYAKGDKGTDEGCPECELWAESTLNSNPADPTMGLVKDGWNLMEYIVGWATDDTGQFVMKLNGVEVFNRQNQRTLGPNDTYIAWISLWQFYGTDSGVQWIDDVEIWSDDPEGVYINPTSVSVSPSSETIGIGIESIISSVDDITEMDSGTVVYTKNSDTSYDCAVTSVGGSTVQPRLAHTTSGYVNGQEMRMTFTATSVTGEPIITQYHAGDFNVIEKPIYEGLNTIDIIADADGSSVSLYLKGSQLFSFSATNVNIEAYTPSGQVALSATPTPTNTTNKNVSWASSNDSIATVDSSGLVTGVAVGSVTITATTYDEGLTDTSTITIN